MHMRTKSALVVSIGLVVAFGSLFFFDYTDTYMKDRFVRAVDKQRARPGDTFSLDALMESYDWDGVCLLLPGKVHTLKNRFGRPYAGKQMAPDSWGLIFVKDARVSAEIHVSRSFLDIDPELGERCFERWAAIFSVHTDPDGHLILSAVE
ncbi:hypothetical protein GO013_01680 [Pseudodesulfovibrio sp. JC047]|uniref:hypothetical protein n=1 Tax=Pseudodesulfovibrio sp. JC047 TaxID=2683199 RepID=UPI0013D7430C|nr:hypothetical protein [Pseudodesulfovibrio sp. JC047]NDV18128.1 hypothetical protein [Pseudodesulfovibrio sp. JC047]